MTHEIRLNYQFAKPVLFGEKRFELRGNERQYQNGDYVRFKVNNIPLDADTDIVKELEKMLFRITFVVSGWGLKNGYVVFGFKEEPDI